MRYRRRDWINLPFITKLGPSIDVNWVLFLRTWSLGVDDDVGNVWRYLAVKEASPDTLQAINISFERNGCVVPHRGFVKTSFSTRNTRGGIISKLTRRENHTWVGHKGDYYYRDSVLDDVLQTSSNETKRGKRMSVSEHRPINGKSINICGARVRMPGNVSLQLVIDSASKQINWRRWSTDVATDSQLWRKIAQSQMSCATELQAAEWHSPISVM